MSAYTSQWALEGSPMAPHRQGAISSGWAYLPRLFRRAVAMAAIPVAAAAETGLIDILDYVVVEDGGTLVNSMIVDG